MKWIAMLRNRYPTELELLTDSEVEHGIRELLEGTLKYLVSPLLLSYIPYI